MVKVTLVLAFGPGHPDGDLSDRIIMRVTLSPQGQLDVTAWENGSVPWLTSRERAGHPVRSGEIVKIDDGWALRSLGNEDEPLYSVTAQVLRPGEIMRVSRLDGDEMLYRIVAVEPD